MKHLLPTLALACCLLSSCSKKEDAAPAAPTYADFTNVPGTLAVSKHGAARYYLTNLQLRIEHATGSDAYQYRGLYKNSDGIELDFLIDSKRTGSAASWIASTYVGGFSGTPTEVEGAANGFYTYPGANATATFIGATYAGSLK